MTLDTLGVDIIELQDRGSTGRITRECQGILGHEPLPTVSPGCPAWAPHPERGGSGCVTEGMAMRLSVRL